MTKAEEIGAAVAGTGAPDSAPIAAGATNAVGPARSSLRSAVHGARSLLATLGPLGAALWALYPVAIVLLVIGLLIAGAGSV